MSNTARLPLLNGSQTPRPCRLMVVVPPGVSDEAVQQSLVEADLERVDGEVVGLQLLAPGEALDAALARLPGAGVFNIVWITAGYRAARGWRAALAQALEQDAALASVTALCLEDPWFSPVPAGRSARGREEGLAAWLLEHGNGMPIELGGPQPLCGVMRAEAAAQLVADHRSGARPPQEADLDGPERDWAAKLSTRGWLHAVSCRVLVSARPSGEPPRGPLHPEAVMGLRLMAGRELWRDAHPLAGVRHAVGEILQRLPTDERQSLAQPVPSSPSSSAEETVPPARVHGGSPVRLHVAHSWGGGLSKWVQDFVRADGQLGCGKGLVLRSVGVLGAFGQRLALYDGPDLLAPIRFWELGVPIHATAVSHLQVRQILREIIEDFGVEQVLVSSLIGHSLDVLRTGLPTVMVAHDHHPFCITLYATFGSECRECPTPRLNRCVEHNPGHRFFREVSPADWEALREAFVETVCAWRIPIAAPTPSVSKRWQSMMPSLDARLMHVIPHGMDLPPAPAYDPPQDGPLRVVVLGRLSPEKGAELLAGLHGGLLEFAELLLVGCGERIDPMWKHPRVTVIEHFTAQELAALLAKLRPDVGLLLSVVPETYSYALSELWHAGIPVVATDNGAFADRIEHGRTGFLEAPDPKALLERLRALWCDRSVLQDIRMRLRDLPARSLADMIQDYERLLPRVGRLQQSGSRQATVGMPAALADGGFNGTARHRHALHVNPEVTWLQAARGFWHYTCLKASRSPRVPQALRSWFSRLG